MKLHLNKWVLIVIFGAFALAMLVILILGEQRIAVITDKKDYENGGSLKVKIQNLFLKKICFSSCYPYYLERKEGAWKAYSYQDCSKANITEKCMEPSETKAFEIALPLIEEGAHRIAVPICESCNTGGQFQESQRFYSNEFEVK